MFAAQILINALVLGCLYACIAIGFSLVWGVLNVINLIHGSFIVLGAYLAWSLYQGLHISPWYALLIAAPLFFVLGYVIQRVILNRVITAPVLVTLTLTFGLDLILNNAMIYYFKADYRKLSLTPPMGSVSIFDVVVPVDRLIATVAALALTGVLYLILRRLNRVRRALLRADPATATVAEHARRHGFTELGRFAVIYRTVFGESPSTTLRRLRGPHFSARLAKSA